MKKVFLPKRGHHVHLHNRHAMKKGHPTDRYKSVLPPVTLPIDWTKNNSLSFPILGNDKEGDCMYAAAVHADQTFTGNNGNESSWDTATVLKFYEKLSGGDNGLDESMLVGEWRKGLCDNSDASILDALDVDPNDINMMQEAHFLFGGVIFMLAVPDTWLNNFDTGAVWDAPAKADENNGHGTWFNGVDAGGRYKVQTWGTYGWVTPAGVKGCDPSAFAVFSLRWFNKDGIAPNGKSYAELSSLWQAAGGKPLPPSPFGPMPPTPPTPEGLFNITVNRKIPVGGRVNFTTKVAIPAGTYEWIPATKHVIME